MLLKRILFFSSVVRYLFVLPYLKNRLLVLLRLVFHVPVRMILQTLTPNGWGIAHDKKQKYEVNSIFKSVIAGFFASTEYIPFLNDCHQGEVAQTTMQIINPTPPPLTPTRERGGSRRNFSPRRDSNIKGKWRHLLTFGYVARCVPDAYKSH